MYARAAPDQRGADGGWKRPPGSAGGVHLRLETGIVLAAAAVIGH